MVKHIIFKSDFMDCMYNNMWTFMNPSMIKDIFKDMGKDIKITYKDDIEDDNFSNSYKNSICFKGDPDDGGHYVYVDSRLNVYGTYELDLLTRPEDDGVCHGVAIIYALGHKLITHKNRTRHENISNYINILSIYKQLINTGLWDNALSNNFYNDVNWIKGTTTCFETKKALDCLDKYINYLHNI